MSGETASLHCVHFFLIVEFMLQVFGSRLPWLRTWALGAVLGQRRLRRHENKVFVSWMEEACLRRLLLEALFSIKIKFGPF